VVVVVGAVVAVVEGVVVEVVVVELVVVEVVVDVGEVVVVVPQPGPWPWWCECQLCAAGAAVTLPAKAGGAAASDAATVASVARSAPPTHARERHRKCLVIASSSRMRYYPGQTQLPWSYPPPGLWPPLVPFVMVV
jgi:hypothetical protein